MSSELAEVGEKRRRFERDDEGFAGGESSEEEEQQKAESRKPNGSDHMLRFDQISPSDWSIRPIGSLRLR